MTLHYFFSYTMHGHPCMGTENRFVYSGVFACACVVYMHACCMHVCVHVLCSLHSYVGTLCTGFTLCHKTLQNCCYSSVSGEANFSMENTSLTIGGFTQPAVARPIIELPSNVEKGLSLRFLCFLFFFPNLATASFKPLSLLMMTSPELSVRCVQCQCKYVLISYSCHTNILHTSYTNGLTTKV